MTSSTFIFLISQQLNLAGSCFNFLSLRYCYCDYGGFGNADGPFYSASCYALSLSPIVVSAALHFLFILVEGLADLLLLLWAFSFQRRSNIFTYCSLSESSLYCPSISSVISFLCNASLSSYLLSICCISSISFSNWFLPMTYRCTKLLFKHVPCRGSVASLFFTFLKCSLLRADNWLT